MATSLNEPQLWRAIEARQERAGQLSENRPRSFLVAEHVPEARRRRLASLNIIPVTQSVEAFLDWLRARQGELLNQAGTLRLVVPELADLEGLTTGLSDQTRDRFFTSFSRVPIQRPQGSTRSLFLLGASPRWEDLLHGLDAPREKSGEIVGWVREELENPAVPSLKIGAILGSAGSGKSTILRRVGVTLEQAGHMAYLTNSESMPTPDEMASVLASLPQRCVLLYDNAEVALSALGSGIRRLASLAVPPVILFTARTNDFDRLFGRIGDGQSVEEFLIPHLSRQEIEAIIDILDRANLLGELKGLSDDERVSAFERKARKQILVAMREATSGRGFDEIIESEFLSLVPEECRHLYLCVSLATDAGFRLSAEEFVACARVPPAETLHLLRRNLRDIVVPTGPEDSLLLLRHRVIARHVLESVAARGELKEAYLRLLLALAAAKRGKGRRSRVFSLYRTVVNHRVIHRRFGGVIDEARAIFQGIASVLHDDAHFWLQYGCLELEGHDGDLQYAENYLAQAESLQPNDDYIRNATAHLKLRQAIEAPTEGVARSLREVGSEILQARLLETRYQDEYAAHILVTQRYRWANVWLHDDEDAKRAEFQWLLDVLGHVRRVHPRQRRLRRAEAVVKQAYLQLGIAKERRPEPPRLEPDA